MFRNSSRRAPLVAAAFTSLFLGAALAPAPASAGPGGFGPPGGMKPGGFGPIGGGGFKPLPGGLGGGFKPFPGGIGGGIKPFPGGMGGGFKPFPGGLGGGFKPGFAPYPGFGRHWHGGYAIGLGVLDYGECYLKRVINRFGEVVLIRRCY